MTISENTFIGEYKYALDSKGRINIPSKFRQCLSLDNQETFIISRGLDSCIYAYPLVVWQEIEENIRKLSSISKQIDCLFEILFAMHHLQNMINKEEFH